MLDDGGGHHERREHGPHGRSHAEHPLVGACLKGSHEHAANLHDFAGATRIVGAPGNQHLRVLRDAGLVTSTRYGRSVLYFRSELGASLLLG